jgi:hypothetical protein
MRHVVCAVAAAWLLTGCNQPAVSLKPPAFQSSENTVRDWNDVASTIAAGLAANGLLPSPLQTPPPNPPAPIFIRVCAPDSTFVRAVADALAHDILQSGGVVGRTPEGATVVNLDVNVVAWGPRDKPPGLLGITAALLTAPVIVLAASAPMATWTAADAAGATAAGLGVLADAAIALTPTMNAEAIWDATVTTGDHVVMKLREPVYVRDRDIPLYTKQVTLAPVASWGGSAPLRPRLLRFDP